MLCALQSRCLRKQLLQRLALSGVRSCAMSCRNSPSKNGLDPPPETRRGFNLGAPDLAENTEHMIDGDFVHQHVTDQWARIGFECAPPLLPVSLVCPARLVRRDIALRSFVKSEALKPSQVTCGSLGALCLNRVLALRAHPPALVGSGSGIGQACRETRPQADFSSFATKRVSVDPSFPAPACNLQITTASL